MGKMDSTSKEASSAHILNISDEKFNELSSWKNWPISAQNEFDRLCLSANGLKPDEELNQLIVSSLLSCV